MTPDLLTLLIAAVVAILLYRLVRGVFRFINRSLRLLLLILIGVVAYLLLRDQITALLGGR